MNVLSSKRFLSLCVATFVSLGIDLATAADVAAQLSRRETYVNSPVTFQISITNASKHDPPEVPEVNGLSITPLGTPSRSSRVSIINGRRSERSSIVYSFRVTPRREGSFTIPAMKIQADGQQHVVPEQQIVASKSETGDLMFVEISGKRDSIYVGQSLDLTLKIWLRPYRDQQRDLVLSEANMWRMISSQLSNWGPFSKRLEELAVEQKRPGGEEVLREDSNGQQRSYYLYEIDATVYPTKPGKIEGDDVEIVVEYPTRLGRSRDPLASFFGNDSLFNDDFFSSPLRSSLSVTAARPITAKASVEPIVVKPIPTDGRPADYRGAVGNYQIVTEAKPTDVKAGDPITLHIGVAGTGPMDLVQAPPLAQLPKLTTDFKVRDEPLAGFVDGSQKVFSTTIRPRRAGISEIPAIPLSYFDPDGEKFVTVYSEPIAIDVAQADTLALDSIVGRSRAGDQPSKSAANIQPAVSFRNHTGPELLENQTPAALSALHLWLLAVPPLLFLIAQLLRNRSRVFATALFKSAAGETRSRVELAQSAADVGSAVGDYLRHRFGHQIATDSAVSAIGVLRTSGHRDLAIRCERVLDACDRSSFATDSSQLSELKQQANQLVDDLEGHARKRKRQPTVKPRMSRTAKQATVMFLLASLSCTSASPLAAAADLAPPTDQQRMQQLREAGELYQQALQSEQNAPADSKLFAKQAAEKYQWVVDSGVTNARLYFNLANAYHKSGDNGRAIANYHRSLQISSTAQATRANLNYVRANLNPAEDVNAAEQTWLDTAADVNSWVSWFVHPRVMAGIAIACWCGVWLILTLRSFGYRCAWKSLTIIALALFVVSAASYLQSSRHFDLHDSAIIVARSAELKSGDGDHFATIVELESTEGQRVQLLHQRGQWAKIQTSSGQTGWLPQRAIEKI